MEMNEQLFDTIERYLLNEMSVNEANNFEKKLASDPSLSEMVDMQRLEHESLELILEDKLRANMKGWQTEPPPPTSGGYRYLWLLGGVLLIVGIAAYWRWSGDSLPTKIESVPQTPIEEPQLPPPDLPIAQDPPNLPPPSDREEEPEQKQSPDLSKEYLAMATGAYEFPQEINLKASGEDNESVLDAGITAFKAGDYPVAITEFSQLKPDIGEAYYERAQELLGHSYFQSGQYAAASEVFSTMAADQEFKEVRQYGEWYSLLSLLPDHSKNKQQIASLLELITNDDRHNYHQQGIALESKLQKLR
ncbi:hypothetical protein [Lewinella cohaerens]|uniref:hypothetical protein n=1 Tax=Lewinella cohaerens TaxID=70995 RepID=UPI00036251A3|nr:hypothetical protein [Lewinella cohaerens]